MLSNQSANQPHQSPAPSTEHVFAVSEYIKASAEAVWQRVGEFGRLGTWHPALNPGKVYESKGNTFRELPTKDGQNVFVERLDASGPDFVRYTMISGLPVQVEAYFGVKSNADGTSTLTWSGKFDANDVGPQVGAGVEAGVTGFYKAGLEAARKMFA